MLMTSSRTCRLLFRQQYARYLFCEDTVLSLKNLFKPISACRFHRSTQRSKSSETELCHHIKTRIRASGPITVADYMKQVLINPHSGYYMHRDVFGTEGDFITSPEISQMFGELVGIWCVNEWLQHGSPPSVQIVELGPGRGTLADDMLRVFSQFKGINKAVSLHLVEVSPKLSELQEAKLTGQSLGAVSATEESQDRTPYRECESKYGTSVSWYRSLNEVPHGFSIYVAHEFFDALPVHIFQKRDGRWNEVMVDVDDSEDGEHHLRLVLSYNPTAASRILLQVAKDDLRDHKELCPEAGIIVEELVKRISENSGAALIADYGHLGEKSDTFRAFRRHQLHDPLCEPGTADLTADVDFSYLKRIVGDKIATVGPVTQGKFLQSMGIAVRLQVLLGKASEEQKKSLMTGFDMLINPEKMGERFKFFAMYEFQDREYYPAGFAPM